LTTATQCSMVGPTSAVSSADYKMVLNAAARLVVGLDKYEHITPVLRDVLHWLPVPQRIQFKIAALTFDCVWGTWPAYFSSIACTVADNSGRPGLRLAERGDLFVPRTRTTNGRDRGFGPTGNIRAIRSADTEYPTVEPNMKRVGWSVAEIWPFEIFQNFARLVGRTVVGRSSVLSRCIDHMHSSSLR